MQFKELLKHESHISPKASRGYCLKLARVLNGKYHRSFNDAHFCQQYDIILKQEKNNINS